LLLTTENHGVLLSLKKSQFPNVFTFNAESELASSWQHFLQSSFNAARLNSSSKEHEVQSRFGVKPRLLHSSSVSWLQSPSPRCICKGQKTTL